MDIILHFGVEFMKLSLIIPCYNEAENVYPFHDAVLEAFKEGAILDWSELLASTNMSMGELAMIMMELELKGAIRTLPGKRYEII